MPLSGLSGSRRSTDSMLSCQVSPWTTLPCLVASTAMLCHQGNMAPTDSSISSAACLCLMAFCAPAGPSWCALPALMSKLVKVNKGSSHESMKDWLSDWLTNQLTD